VWQEQLPTPHYKGQESEIILTNLNQFEHSISIEVGRKVEGRLTSMEQG